MNFRSGIILSLIFMLIFFSLHNGANTDPNIPGLKNKTPDKRVKAPDILKASTIKNLKLDRLIDRTQLIENYNLKDTRKKNIFFTYPLDSKKTNEIKLQSPTPIATPTAPLLPFTYLGKKLEAEKWEVYLSRGVETLIVREQSELDSNYRIESIQPPNMYITYLPLKLTQTMNIGAPD